jgi:hypothetical protein
LLIATGAALGHQLLLLDEHGSLRVLALEAEQVLLNEPTGHEWVRFPALFEHLWLTLNTIIVYASLSI